MKKYIWVASLVVLMLGAASTALFAEAQPSAKATVSVSNITILDSTTSADWTTILSNDIKTSEQKDLFADVSLESGLYTRTLVKSKGGTSDTSTAEGALEVRVLVDGVAAEPGPVIFARRTQTLTAVFQGLLEGCLSVAADGSVIIDEDCLEPEELELILDTMNANSFNFVSADVGAGTHTVEVQAKIDTDTSAEAGEAVAKASVGKGSVTIESVRLIKDEDILV